MEQKAPVQLDFPTPFPPPSDVVRMASPAGVGKPGYYGLPMLKRPLWKWEIALYFFGEGISSGCFILATAADLCGGGRYRRLIRAARYLSFVAVAPCAPLLIHDLGRPGRFHHMLRVFKPSSPMNLGAWALSGFAPAAALMAASQAAEAMPEWIRPLMKCIPRLAVNILGLPFAMVMLAYPGVLLATTSTPLWASTRWMGALLGSSSMMTAASALALATALGPWRDRAGRKAIARIEDAAHVCEAGVLAAYLYQSGRAARPLTRGGYARMFWLGAVGCGIVAPAIIGMLRGKRPKRRSTIASSLFALAGGFALKWAIVHGGHESALDSDANRWAARPTAENPGWQAAQTRQVDPGEGLPEIR